jgi:hypothetical protein
VCAPTREDSLKTKSDAERATENISPLVVLAPGSSAISPARKVREPYKEPLISAGGG